jgi:1-deoxy-D-xylulose-5-phosphate synthase
LPYVKIYFQVFITLDLRQLDEVQLPQLAQELRDFIIDIVSVKEGHLGQSGVIELTIALHYVFNTPDDLFVWDVGHQHTDIKF